MPKKPLSVVSSVAESPVRETGVSAISVSSESMQSITVQPNTMQPDSEHSTAVAELQSVSGYTQEVQQDLRQWWDGNARDLPWRFGRTTPWGVLVSEVMSQQTQMSRVVPYWLSWMETWPDAQALSLASTAEVVTAWGRLGYPRRALRLQECARAVCSQYGGELPTTYEELIALPGIGDYTASAVLSFAFGKRIAVIDTNIRRVLSRVFLGVESRGGSASAEERELAQRVLPTDFAKRKTADSVVWNQAVMELGAVVCAAKQPLCDACPISGVCKFLAAGLPELGERRTRPRQRFAGTNRQVRGIVLEALRSQHKLSSQEIHELWHDHIQLDACIASLDNDGLIEIQQNGDIAFPE